MLEMYLSAEKSAWSGGIKRTVGMTALFSLNVSWLISRNKDPCKFCCVIISSRLVKSRSPFFPALRLKPVEGEGKMLGGKEHLQSRSWGTTDFQMSRSCHSSHGWWPPWGHNKISVWVRHGAEDGWGTLPEEDVPLVKGSLVHQVVGIVCAGEWVIHRLALYNYWGVIGDDGVVEVINRVLELWMVRQRCGQYRVFKASGTSSWKHEDSGDTTPSPRKHGFVAL